MSRKLVADLKAEITRGRVLAVVGAGVSIGATQGDPLASWAGLLAHGIDRCCDIAPGLPAGWRDRSRGALHSGDLDELLSVAQQVASKLGSPHSGEYQRWLQETVGGLQVKDVEVIQALHHLGVPLATTNYDDLLESVTGLPAVTWRDGARVERVVRGEEAGILHLHGYWRDPESVVLGIYDYARVTEHSHLQALLDALWVLKSLLFVGVGGGLVDPHFRSLLRRVKQLFRAPPDRHYQLCTEEEAADLRRRHAENEILLPLLAYGATHSALASFLRDLQPASGASRSVVAPNVAAPGPAPLPAAPRCLGRHAELEEIVAAVCRQPPPPVPILGPPGAGRTALSLAVLGEPRVVQCFGERRWFVPCEGTTSRDELAAKIAHSLGLAAGPPAEPALFAELQSGPTLLVLDDAEIPWEKEPLPVEKLLSRLAAVRTLGLVVSIRGNQRPFGPPWCEAVRLGPLEPAAAREAFLAVAGERFRLDPHLDALLEAVDRLALAVTTLAYQAEGQPDLADLWQSWQSQRSVNLRRGESVQIQALDVSLALAIGSPRMTPAAGRLLSILGLLPDGVARCDLAALVPGEVREAAATLRRVGLATNQEARLKLLSPFREHVRWKHPPASEDLERVIDHFLLLACHESAPGRGNLDDPNRQLLYDAGNLEAMVLLGLRRPDMVPAVRAALALTDTLLLAGLDASHPLLECLEACRRSGLLPETAACLARLGRLNLEHAEPDAARESFEEARQCYRRDGDLLGEAHCLKALGDVALVGTGSDPQAAGCRFREALELYRRAGYPSGMSRCFESLGDLALQESSYGSASGFYEQASQLDPQGLEPLSAAGHLKTLGDLARSDQLHGVAEGRYRQALALFRRSGHALCEALCWRNLGDVALAQRDFAFAGEAYARASALFESLEHVAGTAACLLRLGDLAAASNDPDLARSRYREALDLYRSGLPTNGAAWCARRLGDFAFAERDVAAARDFYEEAFLLYRRIANVLGEIYCAERLGEIAVAEYGDLSGEPTPIAGDFPSFKEILDQLIYIAESNRYRSIVITSESTIHLGSGDPTRDLLAKAQTRQYLGRAALERGNCGSAKDLFSEAAVLPQRVGFPLGSADFPSFKEILDQTIYLAKSNWYRFIGITSESTIHLGSGDPTRDLLAKAQTRQHLGRAALERGNYGSAEDLFSEAAVLFQRVGFPLGRADCLKRLGDVSMKQGRAGPGRARYREALALYQEVEGRKGEAYCLKMIGRAAGRPSRPESQPL